MTNPWLTWANLLTALRALAIPFFAQSILNGSWYLASGLFVVAVVTDFFDGKLARKFDQTSPLGGLLDHGTDAAFVTTGCWALASLGLINHYLAWLIPLAFIQYMLDSRALSGHNLRTSTIGRSNGVAYFVVVGVGVGSATLGWSWLNEPNALFAWLLVASTVVSMTDRAIALVRRP